ncbi:uncharacterized protein BX663DRAFT_481196 [Cokeromyces recurvatus]|uniref:uncharacterized protein n=1 Tax=Cokeromyces recurvatus TaxID=90255 RepID=UPI00221EFFD8|nr:uncharacterized protein BX663DRAFT_481196 [Cokeromyces recurvatus]KAI7897751.1 hypothetical protein BX663DRAFT_481196 [Cokeromyces recurvatus]
MKIVLCSLLLLPLSVLGQFFNYGTRFPKNKLYNLEPQTIGLDNIDGTVAAFGDFNGDKFTDLFVLSADQTSVSIFLWNHQEFTFKRLPTASSIQPGFIITNVVPGDYNYDGKLDVLLMGEQNPENNPTHEIKMQIYIGNGNDTFEQEAIKLPSAYNALPIVLDVNGDMKTDILGYAENTNKLSVWINEASTMSNDTTSLYNLTSASPFFDEKVTDKCVWANPHSNAFVDLNGDCLADLIFVCTKMSGTQSLQIWTNDRQQGFVLHQEAQLPTGAGPLSFGDIDGDGSIDIVFPVCKNDICTIHVVYNQQIGLCQNQNDKLCRKAQNLCVADHNFKFDFTRPNSENYVVFDLDSVLLDAGEIILTNDNGGFRGKLPVPIHIGDYNLDGYPDVLVTTTERVILLKSVLCTLELCTSNAKASSRRSFEVVTTGAEILNQLSNPSQATFFDIDEDGTLDILVLQNIQGKDAGRLPNFIVNNYFNDAFFLKGLVSNGAEDLTAYGVSYPGASLKFTVLDTSGVKRSHQVSQLSQSAYMSLLTPYCLFGLGRTNNYVEELFAGVSRHQHKNYFFYEGVIPNSQLVFLPYQPDHIQDSSSWKVELYIKPADYVPWVLAVLVAASIILGIVVVVLRIVEKREDEMERRKALHIINFDAL